MKKKTSTQQGFTVASADRDKALETALAQIERQFGKGTVMRLGDDDRPPIESIPTGSIALDVALGIGGIPRGRIVEVYGPESSGKTTVALHAVANAQHAGGIAAFVDAEHALDPDYAKKIGVDTDNLLLSQPDTGEQALEITDMLIRSGAISIIVIDSVAALVPRAEIEGEMGDSHVGLQARLMSQALRKIAGALHQTGTTAIFINQLREKVGVMFGCMDYHTPVTLADGSQEKVGAIVDQRMDVEVLSYDPDTDRVVPRPVVNWFDNGTTEHFLRFTVAGAGENAPAQFSATPNHLLRTPGGWREAGELLPGDRVLTAQPFHLSEQQRQLLLGSIMGGADLSAPPRGHSGARWSMSHPQHQADYLDWKLSLLPNVYHTRISDAAGRLVARSRPLPELDELAEVVEFDGATKHLTWEFLKSLTPLALAVWYMDAGSLTSGLADRAASEHDAGRIEIPVAHLSPGSQQRLTDYLRDTHGLDVTLAQPGPEGQTCIRFTTAATAQFQELVAPYVPSVNADVLPQRLRGQCRLAPDFAEPEERLVATPVVDVEPVFEPEGARRFDIEVAGHHNYFVDGVMVHNSPETTTGGRALKFYSSVRLDVRRIETLKDGTDAVGNRTRVKVVKNKTAPPFKQAEMDILYGVGISREGGLIDLGVENGVVRKSGAWYTYEGTQLGQGKENARNFLRDNADMANEVEKKIKEKLGVPTGSDDSAKGEAAGSEAAAGKDTKSDAKSAASTGAKAKTKETKESEQAAESASPTAATAKRTTRSKATPSTDA
ncbi:intein-containing recombinase RecA [Salinactinospora qingdaonensis]|uniref:Protein RecA n=1 Tax=Salinactinospora qingdaonensis TaxID=702744 RepID=A0ABP7G8W6_9ACTN